MEGNVEQELNPTKQSSTETEEPKQLFGHCFEISKLKEGDSIPVGGKNILSDEVNIRVTADFENLRQFLSEAHELAGKYDLLKLNEWLKSQEIDVDPKLFSVLFAFTKVFEEKYPDNPQKGPLRRELYHRRDKEAKLSDFFNANIAECAEVAALAQAYLQQEGIVSSYLSGEVLWRKDYEFSEPHSYIIIHQQDRAYLFDPANPVKTTSGQFPSIYTTEADFDEEIAKRRKVFVTAKNILSKNEAFYGVNDGTNVIAEEHII